MTDLRFPIGKFTREDDVRPEMLGTFIDDIEAAPARLRKAVDGLSKEQLDTPYRPEGWTVRQVVHHMPDSHLNSYMRFRLALTEDEPLIRTYHEDKWAELADAKYGPVDLSLDLFESLHQRWVILLNSMEPSDFQRRLRHPHLGLIPLDTMLGIYGWHGRHHTAHITTLREREGW
ncbi:MAG TPA: putative metal-dependent hydrolase [Blastocatellia bacterium]